MNTGKLVRMNRIFSHASGRLCSVAVDHFIGYGAGLPAGLRHIGATLAAVVAARPDAVTMHKGIAASAWQPYAGRVPLIMQSTAPGPTTRPASNSPTRWTPCGLGPTASPWRLLFAARPRAPLCGSWPTAFAQAAAYEMPVICHIYPRDQEQGHFLRARGHRLGGALRGGGGRGRGEDALLRRRGGLRADRRRLSGAAGGRRRAEGRHASRGAGDDRRGRAERRPRRHHRPKHLGLRADRRGGAGLQGGDSRRQDCRTRPCSRPGWPQRSEANGDAHSARTSAQGDSARATRSGSVAFHLHRARPEESGIVLRARQSGRDPRQPSGAVSAAFLVLAGDSARLLARRVRGRVEPHRRQRHRRGGRLPAEDAQPGRIHVPRSARSAAIREAAGLRGRPLPTVFAT